MGEVPILSLLLVISHLERSTGGSDYAKTLSVSFCLFQGMTQLGAGHKCKYRVTIINCESIIRWLIAREFSSGLSLLNSKEHRATKTNKELMRLQSVRSES